MRYLDFDGNSLSVFGDFGRVLKLQNENIFNTSSSGRNSVKLLGKIFCE
jgi:hypothetical protein